MSEVSAPAPLSAFNRSNWRRAAGLGASIILALASLEIATRSIAGYLSADAASALSEWHTTESALPVSTWERIVENLELALALDDNNPTMLHLLGEVYRTRTMPGIWDAPLAQAQEDELLARARDALSRSTALRPRWAPALSLLAMLKADLGEFDAEFKQALDHAMRYGPWDGNVAWQATRAGLLGWGVLNPELRAAVLENVLRGLISRDNAVPGQVEALFFLHLNKLGPQDVTTLQNRLLASPWPIDRLGKLTRFTVQLWEIWSPDGQAQLRSRIIENYRSTGADKGKVLWEISQAGQLFDFCPSLPTDKVQRLFCRQF